jgi:hypothetical protein
MLQQALLLVAELKARHPKATSDLLPGGREERLASIAFHPYNAHQLQKRHGCPERPFCGSPGD